MSHKSTKMLTSGKELGSKESIGKRRVEDIKELRSTIAPVEAKEVVVYNSGDEDVCSDLLMK